MIDHAQRQTLQAHKEGRELLMDHCTHEQANNAMKQRLVPPGSVWLWATGMWGPPVKTIERNHWSETS